MTVADYLIDIYESCGEDSQLDPYTSGVFDLTRASSTRVLGWLNRGYRILTNFRRPDGSLVRFPRREDVMHFQTYVLTGTAAAGTSTTITLDSDADATVDIYNGWLVETTGGTGSGQIRMIVDYTALRVATVHDAWDTTPDTTTTYRVTKRQVKVLNTGETGASLHITASPANSIGSILKIIDIDDQREIPYAGRAESFAGNTLLTVLRPEAWFSYAGGLVWDAAPQSARWYQMEYEKEFGSLTAGTDEPLIPPEWQEALFLWLLWKARTWTMEPNAAYGAKRDFYDFVSSLKLPQETLFDRTDAGVRVRV